MIKFEESTYGKDLSLMKYFVIFLSTLYLAGCGLTLPHPASLLEHPALPEWEKSLKTKIDEDLPAQAEIVAPRNQSISRLYELIDLNRDGREEAVTFYRMQDQGTFQIKLLVHERMKKKWVLRVSQPIATGRSIDQLHVILDESQKSNQLMIGVTSLEKNTVYLLKDLMKSSIDVTKIDTYDRLTIADLNQDQRQDMVLLKKGQSTELVYYEEALTPAVRQTTLLPIREGDLFADHDLFEIDTINAAKKKGLLVSFTRDATMHLLVFQLDQTKLTPVDFAGTSEIIEPMYTFPKDVDQDGIVEFAHQYTPKGSIGRSMEEKPQITAYYAWNGASVQPFLESGFELREEQYIDLEYNFVMRFPANWATRETIEKKDNRVRFINRETGTIDFELEIIPKNQYIASHQKKKIKEGIDYVYVITANQSYEKYATNVALVE
ncbi:Hypothetical protein Eab7_2698 [Exiguobacterium antarcticum B7]|nr:Hypothetical protein Eab7_2698 [Exiguobacterium antarcticum B7]